MKKIIFLLIAILYSSKPLYTQNDFVGVLDSFDYQKPYIAKFERLFFGIGTLLIKKSDKSNVYWKDLKTAQYFATLGSRYKSLFFPKDSTILVFDCNKYYDYDEIELGYQILPYEFALFSDNDYKYLSSYDKGITIGCSIDSSKKKEVLYLIDYAFKNLNYMNTYRDSILLTIKEKKGAITLSDELIQKILSTPNRRVDKFLRQEERRRKRGK